MYAIKGTNEDMQCRGFQYELGKTYKMDEEPIVCLQGFHACLNPYDVLDYYENDGYSRYFLVELGGTITDCDDPDTKVVANEITFLKEVSVNDFPALYEEFRKDKERLAKLFYEEGLARVYKNGKYNFINKNGRYISKKWFDDTYSFYEGFALVEKDRKYNFINKDGKLISKKWFDDANPFSDGFALVEKGRKDNFINKDGKLISKDWFDEAWWFSEGFAKVRKYDKWNFIDKDGNYLCKEWFDYAHGFSHGFVIVSKNNKYYRLYPDGHLEVS